MSHFYANIQGNRGEATRGGSKDSGIDGHIRGWNSGAKVICEVNDKDQDVVEFKGALRAKLFWCYFNAVFKINDCNNSSSKWILRLNIIN